tara:strand:+ start:794 stop:1042 length:249 start_codon:yes stop_codon:yes gene_type:complete
MSDYYSIRHESRPSLDELFGFDTDDITDVKWEGVNYNDHPDYSDAYIASAKYRNKEMTEAEIELLMQNYPNWCYDNLMEAIF